MTTSLGNIWQGVFDSFDEANADQIVFEGGVWLEKEAARATKALAGASGPSAIPKIATTFEYVLPFIAATALRSDKHLEILDFGGGMARSFVTLAAMLPSDAKLRFAVVENKAVCARGRQLFAGDERVSFREEMPHGELFDIVHAGSSLHYVDNWQTTLGLFASTGAEYLVFVDLPAADNVTFVTTQSFHGQRIPVRFWNIQSFVDSVQSLGYRLILKSRYRGYYLPAEAELPTDNFDDSHRLEYFSQLVFRRIS